MITSISLENFKSVRERTDLRLEPLTIFVGANSSGKSTIIQSLLLVAQTLQNPDTSRPVVLNGPILRLGSFKDVISHKAQSGEVAIGFGIGETTETFHAIFPALLEQWNRMLSRPRLPIEVFGMDFEFSFSGGTNSKERETFQLHPQIEKSSLRTEFPMKEDPGNIDGDVVIVRRSKKSASQRVREHPRSRELFNLRGKMSASQRARKLQMLNSLGESRIADSAFTRYEVERCSITPVSSKQSGAALSHFLPYSVRAIYNEKEEIARQLELARPLDDEDDDAWGDFEDQPGAEVQLFPATQTIVSETLLSLAIEAKTKAKKLLKSSDEPSQREAEYDEIRARLYRIWEQRLKLDAEMRGRNSWGELIPELSVRDFWRVLQYRPEDYRMRVRQRNLRWERTHGTYSEAISEAKTKGDMAQVGEIYLRRSQEFRAEGITEGDSVLFVNAQISERLLNRAQELHAEAITEGDSGDSIWAQSPERLRYSADYISLFFNRLVKYLGPLREEPRPVYPAFSIGDSKDVGYKGEYTAAVLQAHRNTRVKYIPSHDLTTGASKPKIRSTTLLRTTLDWLQYMGVASDVKTFDRGRLGLEFKVSTPDDESLHDLMHVGVGVSQVLPILVLSLLAEPGSVLIFEQPELHLHPKVQTRLADFFTSMVLLGKQCIVETHSEYLINRMRYQAALFEDDTITDKVLVYFVEKEQGQSKFKPIKINKFGVIEDWPRGFFDESEIISAEILKAAMQKRKRSPSKNED